MRGILPGEGQTHMLDGYVDLERDQGLVELHHGGDGTAFTELYSHYHRRLRRFCQRKLRTPNDADEAVQESFMRAWRAFHRFEGERFYPWLTVIASNVCSDMAKRRSRMIPVGELPEAPAASEPEVDAALMGSEEVELLAKAFGRLSDRYQRILSLRETALWTSRRIAEHEGMKVNAVDVTLCRARQALKREMVALVDVAGSFVAVLGTGALRRAWWRTGMRLSGWWAAAAPSSFTPRSPSVLATVVISGAAAVAAGGGVAVVAHTVSSPAPVSAPVAQNHVAASSASSISSEVLSSLSTGSVSQPAANSTSTTPAASTNSATSTTSVVHHQEASTTTAMPHGSLVSTARSPAKTAGWGPPILSATENGFGNSKPPRTHGGIGFTGTKGDAADAAHQPPSSPIPSQASQQSTTFGPPVTNAAVPPPPPAAPTETESPVSTDSPRDPTPAVPQAAAPSQFAPLSGAAFSDAEPRSPIESSSGPPPPSGRTFTQPGQSMLP